ncbi:uncharacterized protein LOC123545326 [Mercenaria mercenaria]|uniref:uncharacterized protein LOC123545326 n=1 Tax=Mercenaria mercenaria TaxID=6596 RepID=UPI00234F37AE|nr:uncharacterized protein LOC123545326 [Mercenaria mercenaria]
MRLLFRGLLTRSYGNCAIQRIRNNNKCKERNNTVRHNTTYRRFLQTSASQQNEFKSPRRSVEIPEISLSDYMFSRFSEFRNRKALVDNETGTVYTYSQLENLSRKVDSFFYRKGFRKNDVICYYGTNNPEFALLLLGCASIGVVLTTANPAYTSGELKRQIEHSGAMTLATVPSLVSKAQEAEIKDIIVNGNADRCRSFFDILDRLDGDGNSFPTDINIDPHNDVVIMPYSSGTTGLPKGAMLSHYNIYPISYNTTVTDSSTDDINLAVLPFYHIYGMVIVLCDTLQCGGLLVTTTGVEPEAFLKAIVKHKVTQLHVVPPLLLFLTRHPTVDEVNLSRIRNIFCGAAPLGMTITEEFMKKRNKTVRQGYGLTETSPVVSVESVTAGTVGPLTANTEVKFVDPTTGKILEHNEVGELCIRGPQNMKGYFNNVKATKEMTDEDGWLHTVKHNFKRHMGDNDCIVITDRLKELIKYKGFQVAPAELEDLIHKHPAVQDVAVIGMPDDRAGELPRAYVVLIPSTSLHAHDVVKYVEQNVSDYKRLRGGVVKEIPKSPSGKILRRLLKDFLSSSQL